MKQTQHHRRKAMGRCVRCGQLPIPGRTMCQKHLDDVAFRRASRINNSLCVYCRNPSIGKTICKDCSLKRAMEREERIAYGLCANIGCDNDRREGKTTCVQCSAKISDKIRELKQLVLDHYGQVCNCSCGCKVTKFEHLTIDHINNDGAEQRKARNAHSGQAEYRRIIRERFPKDLQVLCWNCNCAKQYYGGCQ